MKIIRKSTSVISASLPQTTISKMERVRTEEGISKSSFIKKAIESYAEDERWNKIYKKGTQTAKKFKITSEEDIDKILHG